LSERFDVPSGGREEELDPQELRALLERLECPDDFELALDRVDTDTVTVAAICEATGIRANEILKLLEEIRERHTEAKLAEAIREMEAPTHSVERPGRAAPDGLRRLPPLERTKMLSSLIDDVVRARQPRISFSKKEGFGDKSARVAAAIILICLIVLFVVVIAVGARAGLGV
jgi:hypothetical protein